MHIKKLTKSESIKIIGHDFRHHETYKNKNVDKEKSCNNIVFEDCPNFSKIEKYLTDKEIYVHGKGGKSENKINFLTLKVVQLANVNFFPIYTKY